jgi:Heterokaryon incompatibility protein (HET)
MNYTYSGLRLDELRLLRVVDANVNELRFDILHVSRESAPPYTAVSYTWGDNRPTHWIRLNGRQFHVRINLWSCLYYLSQASKSDDWGYIWVDAICIDQSNDLERNAQVSRMDETYRDAACVSVWLGLVHPPEFYLNLDPTTTRTFDVEDFDWRESISDVANRPYWSRFWVIQEFLLGHEVRLYCSGNRIDWDIFQEILGSETVVNFLSSGSHDLINTTSPEMYAAVPLLMGRHPDRHPEFLQPLHDLLLSHRNSQCKDPRDRVFALLGLVAHGERELLNRFFPDYQMSEDLVFVITLGHVTFHALGGKSLDIQQVLLALGIKSNVRGKRLLEHLKSFSYPDRGSLQRIQGDIDYYNIFGEPQSELSNQYDDVDAGTDSGCCTSGPLIVLLVLFVLGAALWMKGRYILYPPPALL